jgi:hypothetical protein
LEWGEISHLLQQTLKEGIIPAYIYSLHKKSVAAQKG